MRIRTIKPEFWKSPDIGDLTYFDRLLFIGLWSYVDDNGVGIDRLNDIAADLFRTDLIRDPEATITAVERGLHRLTDADLTVRYIGHKLLPRGKLGPELNLICVKKWTLHQRISRPQAGRFTLPTSANVDHANDMQIVANSLPGTEDQGNRGSGEQGNRGPHPLPDDWTPTEKHREKARALGVDVDSLAQDMKRWAFAKDVTRTSWNATFNSFLARAKPGTAGRPKSAADIDWSKV